MLVPPGVFPIGELLATLTEQVVAQQRRLDTDYRARLEAYQAVWQTLREHGLTELATELLPQAFVIEQTEIETRLRFAASAEREFSLNVQPLNLGLQRRHAHAHYAESKLQIKVQRIPLNPDRQTPARPEQKETSDG